MKWKNRLIPQSGLTAPLILLCLSVVSGAPAAETNALGGALQKGLFEEEANRNYAEAIKAYQAALTSFEEDRKLAATALFRLAECYRKQGNTNEAVSRYEALLREFPGETAMASLSRQQLLALG